MGNEEKSTLAQKSGEMNDKSACDERSMNLSLTTITELKIVEINKLLNDKIYRRFFPVICNDCGSNNGFNRRIFLITGVPSTKHSDDETQEFFCAHFFQQYNIENIFFRNNAKKFYVDSASCQKCQSTSIVFDIDIGF